MINYKVTTGPAEEPITLAEAKLHLKVDFTTEDTWITNAIQAAREVAESYTETGLIAQTVTQKLNSFPVVTASNPFAEIILCKSPLRSITSLSYTDTDGVSQSLTENTDYISYSYRKPPRLGLANGQSWPTTLQQAEVVTIVYSVGYDDAAAVPKRLKQGMLMLIGYWYERRQNDPQSPFNLKPGVSEMLFDTEVVY